MAFNRKLFDAIHGADLSLAPKGAKPVTAPLVIWETEIAGYPIKLWRKGSRAARSYAVEYGAQFKRDLTRDGARKELSECIFHALSCDGRLD